MGSILDQRAKRRPFDLAQMKVAAAGGITPYLKQRQVAAFFEEFSARLQKIPYDFRNNLQHPAVLDEFEDVGGLAACPEPSRRDIVLWMVRCYIGEAGGWGTFGRNREVFNSDIAAPRILRMFKAAGTLINEDVEAARTDELVAARMTQRPGIARHYEHLVDIFIVGSD